MSVGRCGRLDHLGHGEGLARTRDAEQHLVALLGGDFPDQFLDRLRLVAFGVVVGDDAEASSALGFVRARRPVRRPGRPVADIRIAEFEQGLQRIDRGRGPGHSARMALRRGRLEFGLRRLAEAARFGLDESRVQERRQMLVERLQVRARRLGGGRAAAFRRRRHERNMGRVRGVGKGCGDRGRREVGRAAGTLRAWGGPTAAVAFVTRRRASLASESSPLIFWRLGRLRRLKRSF